MALGGLAACGSNEDSPATPAPQPATGSNWQFPQSVASGDPRADGILLWTRVIPASADAVASAPGAGDFSIRLIVTAADNAALIGTTIALTGALAVDSNIAVYARYDHTLRNKVSGLKANTEYFYQFVAGDIRSRVGRFRTAPAAGADVAELRFAFITCQDWTVNHWAGFESLANENIDFVVHLGDYIYETVGEAFQSGAVETRHDALVLPDGAFKSGTSGAKYATTLADYRYLYKKYRTDRRLQALHERMPFIATWDDHEFSDDCWQDAETYDNGTYDAGTGTGDNTHQTDRRRSANRAWFEFMPADVAYDETTTSFSNVRIYRDLPFGKLAHFVVTDERLYRADHVIPEATPGTGGTPLGSVGARYFVPADMIAAAEASKMSKVAAGSDSLAPVSMLGTTQRDWWKKTMSASPATWKLWCNEVSLLRMGLDGTAAVATLLSLLSVGTLTTNITTAAGTLGGDVAQASALVAATTAGADKTVATTAAAAIAAAIGASGDPVAAATSAGLTTTQANLAVTAYRASAAASGASAQATAGAQVIAFGYMKPDIIAKGAASSFVGGLAGALAPYFTRFLLNCDQWDGYNAERKHLMAHLKTNSIRNVVGLTGDLHSFHAGTVSDDFDATGAGTPVMVDFVTAGMSSDSWFKYFTDATTGSLLSTLVFSPLSVAVSGVGTIDINFNVFDYTLQRSAPTLDQLAEQARLPIRRALGAKGVTEADLDAKTNEALATLKSTPAFSGNLLGLATQLASLNSNPWIKHMVSDAQGYSLVTLKPDGMSCVFRQLNPLVGTTAPTTAVASSTSFTVARDVVAVTRVS
ncbi:hypothetical protein GCM10025771_27140 [Niveibacterium umoris]